MSLPVATVWHCHLHQAHFSVRWEFSIRVSLQKKSCSVPFFVSQNKAENVFFLSSLLLQDCNLTGTDLWLWNMAHYWVVRRESTNMWNEYTKKNLVPLYENNLRWRLRNNEDLYELLCGHDMVKYIQKITMSWSYAWYIWIILEHQKKYWKENSMEEDVGKQYQEELLPAAECERLEVVCKGQDHLEVTYWRLQGLMWTVPPLKYKSPVL